MNKPLYIITLLFLLSLPVLGAEEYHLLNSTAPRNVSIIIYEITDVDFDHTFNTLLITSKNRPLNLNFTNENMFIIWDFSVFVDNKPYAYFAKPHLEENGRFQFNYTIPVNGTQFVKITYFMNNVRQNRSEFWYPFDSYYLFLKNYNNISKGTAITKKVNFPKLYMDGDINVTYLVNISDKELPGMFIASIRLRENGTKYTKIVGEFCWIDNKTICGINNVTIIKYLEAGRYKIISPNLIPTKEFTNVYFERSKFPKYLFWIFLFYILFTTINFIISSVSSGEFRSQDYLRNSVLTWVIAQLPVTLSQPARPLNVTIFDLIIIIPFITIGVYALIALIINRIIKNHLENQNLD